MKTRLAVIGLGHVAEHIHLPACRAVPELEVVGGCDPNEETRRRMAEKFRLPSTYASVGELLQQTRPDVVIVGTPPDFHFDVCRQALEAGAHVLCEKPFMRSMEEAAQVIALAGRENLLLRVNNQYRFMPIYRETKQRLERGDFGHVHYIQCWQQMFHPPAVERNWRNQLKQYVLFEFATHALDLICYFFEDLPSALNMHTPRCRPEFDADVLVHGTLRFPGERLAAVSLNRVSHAPKRYLEFRLDCEKASLRLSLGGVARCSVEWSSEARRPLMKSGFVKGGQARVERDGRSQVYCESREPQFHTATAEHLKVFLAEMRKPQRDLSAVRHSQEVLRLVFAGYESAQSGETVWLNERRTSTATADWSRAATHSGN